MKTAIRILHLEDDACDAELVRESLKRSGTDFEIQVVSNKKDFLSALEALPPDVIVSDNSIPGLDGMSAMRVAHSRQAKLPFIFLSGVLDAKTREERLEAGASECLVKSEFAKLAGAITRSLQEVPVKAPPSEWYVGAMERLVGVIQELSMARNLERIMEIVRTAARQLTGADGATFVLRAGDQCHYADEDAIEPLWKGKRFPMSACISGWAMLNRQAAVIEDIYADVRIPADAYRPTFVKSLVMVPIRRADPVAAIGTYWATRRAPRAEEVRVLQALADSTSVAMENVQLYSNLEDKVKDRTARLEVANQELEAFSYSVSHDLRAPLRHIGGYLDMLRDDPASFLSSEGARFVCTATDAAQRMGRLIEDLLAFSKMGRAEMLKGRVNMQTLVAEVASDLRIDTKDRNIVWEIDELPQVEGDTALLRQVWANLLSNAVKYTSKRECAKIQVRVKAVDGAWQFSVEDNGAGFDNEYAGRLFGVFQRLHGTDEFEGTGVGLANVRRIVGRHGGRTWADGRVGEGATFYFTLPASRLSY